MSTSKLSVSRVSHTVKAGITHHYCYKSTSMRCPLSAAPISPCPSPAFALARLFLCSCPTTCIQVWVKTDCFSLQLPHLRSPIPCAKAGGQRSSRHRACRAGEGCDCCFWQGGRFKMPERIHGTVFSMSKGGKTSLHTQRGKEM